MRPTFSVILPLRNVAPWLPECLASLRAQTWPDWEGLCVDDGSTDATGALLAQALREEPRLRAIFQPPAGVSRARNRALGRVRGEAVAFLDGDDMVQEWWLRETAHLFEETRADVVWFAWRIFADGTPPPLTEKGRTPPLPIRVFPSRKEALPCGCDKLTISCWDQVFRAGLALGGRFSENLRLAEDSLYGFDLLPLLQSACECSAPAYLYRQRRSSAVHSMRPAETLLALFSEFHARLAATAEEPCRRRALAFIALMALIGWGQKGQRVRRQRQAVRAAASELMRRGRPPLLKGLAFHWLPALHCYLLVGWLWPLRLTSWALGLYGSLRARFRHA